MTMQAGFEAKIKINAVRYTTQYWAVNYVADDLVTTNTEGTGGTIGQQNVGFHTRISGNQQMEMQITNASFDPSENPFAAPINTNPGLFVHLQLYAAGLTHDPFDMLSGLLVAYSMSGSAPGLQPISLTARSNGAFLIPVA